MIRRVLIVIVTGLALAAAAVGIVVARRAPQPAPDAAVAPPAAPAAADAEAAPAAPAPRREPPPAPAPGPEAIAIEPPRELGRLQIDSDVPGANVFIDRTFIGTTPVVVDDVRPGAHRLNVSADGYDGFAETIDVEPGPREIRVELAVVRLDASVEVVHDHRFGSCEGRLEATPDGLRYETSNENDRFDVPLSGLEVFEIDYLEKRLTVKLAGGREYHFSDPDGDADRLFVFHRDVEQAAARLARGDAPATP